MRPGLTCHICGSALVVTVGESSCPGCKTVDQPPARTLVDSDQTVFQENPRFELPASLESFGDYEIIEEIAQGGMGVVFKARQKSLNRTVALKMVRSERLAREEDIRRFILEAQAAAGLQHPNIVAIHEVGKHEGQHFYVMDYIAGQSLAEHVREQPLSARRAAEYMAKIARTIHFAHEHGILHRDLKPANVLIDEADEPRVTDFGLAKVMHDDSRQTLSGTVMGTPSYMSPEQGLGKNAEMRAASDVYSLGAMLYEMVTGRAPFRGETPVVTLRLLLETDAAPPRLLNPRIPVDLETICLKCIEKRPERRYASALALAEDLEAFLRTEPIRARPVGVVGRTTRWCRRKPALAASVGVIAMLILLVAMGAPIAAYRINQGRLLAESRELTARQNGYAAEMLFAAEEIAADNRGHAFELLSRSRPEAGQSDLRGWEWRYWWAQCQTDELFTLGKHEGEIFKAAFLPNGRVVSGDFAATLKLWDVEKRAPIASIRLPDNISDIETAPDGSVIAIAYWRPEFSFRDPDTLEVKSVHPHTSRINHVAFSAKNSLFGTAGNHHAAVWSLRGERPKLLWERGEENITAIAFSPSSEKVVFVTRDDSTVHLHEAESGKEIARFGSEKMPSEIVFSPDGSRLAVSHFKGEVAIYRMADRAAEAILTNHTAWVASMAFSPSAPILVTSSADQKIKVWDTDTWEERATLLGHLNLVDTIALSPSGDRLVSGGKDKTLRVWNTTARPSAKGAGAFPPVQPFFAISWNGKFLATRQTNEAVSIWNLSLSRETQRLSAPRVERVWAVSGDGSHVLVSTADQRLLLLSAESNAPPRSIASGANVYLAAFSRTGKIIAIAERPDKLRVVMVDGAVPDREIPHSGDILRELVFASDTQLFAACDSGFLRSLDLPRGELQTLARLHEHVMQSLALSPDGEQIATGSMDGTVAVWRTRDLKKIHEFGRSAIGFDSLAFTRDGLRLAARSSEGAIKIWAIDSGREVARLKRAPGEGGQMRFTPDDLTLISGTANAAICYRAASWREIARAERQGVATK